jgi:hypothetical protein
MKVPTNAIGSIIGKAGGKIKQIQSETGAKLWLKDEVLIISGTEKQVEDAKKWIQEIINNSIAVYEHPNSVFNILMNEKQETKVLFKEYEGPFEASSKGKYYEIAFSKGESELLDHKDEAIQVLDLKKSFFEAKEFDLLMVHTCKTIHSLKDRKEGAYSFYNAIGRTTFYPARNGTIKDEVDLKEFAGYNIGIDKDIKCKYHPLIDKKAFETILKFASDFSQTKQVIHGIHLIDQENKSRLHVMHGDKFPFQKNQQKIIFIQSLLPNYSHDVRTRLGSAEIFEPNKELQAFVDEIDLEAKTWPMDHPKYVVDSIRTQDQIICDNDTFRIWMTMVTRPDRIDYEVTTSSLNITAFINGKNEMELEEIRSELYGLQKFTHHVLSLIRKK